MTVAERDVPAGIYSYNCDRCSCLLWQRYPIPLPCYLNYHSSILSNNSTIVRSSNALHLWIRLTLYQWIFVPVDVTEPWSRLFFNHWFWICQFLSDVNSFCFWCCCHSFLRSFSFWVLQSLVLSSESLSSAFKIQASDEQCRAFRACFDWLLCYYS